MQSTMQRRCLPGRLSSPGPTRPAARGSPLPLACDERSAAACKSRQASSAEVKLAETETELNSMLRNLEMRVEENAELGANMEAVQHRWRQLKEDLANRETEVRKHLHIVASRLQLLCLIADIRGAPWGAFCLCLRVPQLDQARHETETVTRTLMAEMKGKVAALNSEIEEKESALREANSSLKVWFPLPFCGIGQFKDEGTDAGP